MDEDSFVLAAVDLSSHELSNHSPPDHPQAVTSEEPPTRCVSEADSVASRFERHGALRKAHLDALRARALEDQLATVTLSPRVGRGPKRGANTQEPAFERLFHDGVRRAQRTAAHTDPSVSEASCPADQTRKLSAGEQQTHLDELASWESHRRAKLQCARQAAEARAAAEARGKPTIDPVSRALAASATPRSNRTPKQASPVRHGTTPTTAMRLNERSRNELVDRLYYRDAEVRRLERQVAALRCADARGAEPQLAPASAKLIGDTLPSASPAFVRLANHATELEERREARRVAADEDLRQQSDVGRYLGSVTHVLGACAKARAAAKSEPRTRRCHQQEEPSFRPQVDSNSMRLDVTHNDGNQKRRCDRLFDQAAALAARRAARLSEQENRQAAEDLRRAAEGRRLMSARGHGAGGTPTKTPSQPFTVRQETWLKTREAAIQRKRELLDSSIAAAEKEACTHTPRTNRKATTLR